MGAPGPSKDAPVGRGSSCAGFRWPGHRCPARPRELPDKDGWSDCDTSPPSRVLPPGPRLHRKGDPRGVRSKSVAKHLPAGESCADDRDPESATRPRAKPSGRPPSNRKRCRAKSKGFSFSSGSGSLLCSLHWEASGNDGQLDRAIRLTRKHVHHLRHRRARNLPVGL